jgi:hypothetical protein
MVLILRSFKVVFDKGNNPILLQQKIIKKWPTDTDLGFDISSPNQTKKFIENYVTENGKLLPHQSKYGDPIVYEMYFWGRVKPWMRDAFPDHVAEKNNINIFPGYDNEGEKLDVKRFGMIRR